jgi:hypothetical protein
MRAELGPDEKDLLASIGASVARPLELLSLDTYGVEMVPAVLPLSLATGTDPPAWPRSQIRLGQVPDRTLSVGRLLSCGTTSSRLVSNRPALSALPAQLLETGRRRCASATTSHSSRRFRPWGGAGFAR